MIDRERIEEIRVLAASLPAANDVLGILREDWQPTERLRLIDGLRDLLAALADAERMLALCAADTTAPDLAQDIEFMKAEHSAALDALRAENEQLKRQQWGNQNRAEVAERGHKAALARDFEQRDEIKRLRAENARLREALDERAMPSEWIDAHRVALARIADAERENARLREFYEALLGGDDDRFVRALDALASAPEREAT